MKRKYIVLAVAVVVAQGSLFGTARPANALIQFQKEFILKYVKKESEDPKEQEFAKTVKEAKCHVCHKGKKKKNFNVYGAALSELLDKKKDKKDKKKIIESLDTVSKQKSDPKDDKSKTFGELIAEKELPGGKPVKE